MQDDFTNVYYTTSAVSSLASYMEKEYCLVILDIQLSDTNSMELLQTMRQLKHTPIMALTDPMNPKEVAAIHQAGADACIEKPVNLDICVAQANSLIQLYIVNDINYGEHGPVIHGEELVIIPRYRQVTVDGKILDLTRKEFDLLYYLASHQEQIFTCRQLYEQIWSDGPAIEVNEAVKSQIKRLRRKLSLVGKNYIQNKWGVGYKFTFS